MGSLVVTKTKEYVNIRVPRELYREIIAPAPEKELTEEEALEIIKEGEREYREGKTIPFDSIKELLED
jgi:hypothetical protein